MGEINKNRNNILSRILQRSEFRYLVIGATTALLELLMFLFCYHFLHIVVGIANTIATIIATSLNFILNRSVTFKSTSSPTRSIVLYGILFFFNMNMSSLCIAKLILIGTPSAISKLFMQVVVTIWNYFAYKHVIFV